MTNPICEYHLWYLLYILQTIRPVNDESNCNEFKGNRDISSLDHRICRGLESDFIYELLIHQRLRNRKYYDRTKARIRIRYWHSHHLLKFRTKNVSSVCLKNDFDNMEGEEIE
jgi:hypothetical protein